MTTTESKTAPSSEIKNAAQSMMQMLTGFWVSQSLYTVTRLGVPDHLKNGPQPISVLADLAEADEDKLYRVMRALSCFGVFDEPRARVFSLTPLSELLSTDHPFSMQPIALMLGEEHYRAWGRLYEGVHSGNSPFELEFGMQVYEYFTQHPRASEIFNAAMTAMIRNDHAKIAEVYDFSRFHTVVDVGGGQGVLLAAILTHHPSVEGILFDLSHVADEAKATLTNAGLASRCHIESGDFFQST